MSNDIDILRSIGKYIPNVINEKVTFPCLYWTVLLTRSDMSENARMMTTNGITVMNACDQFENTILDSPTTQFPKAILSEVMSWGDEF